MQSSMAGKESRLLRIGNCGVADFSSEKKLYNIHIITATFRATASEPVAYPDAQFPDLVPFLSLHSVAVKHVPCVTPLQKIQFTTSIKQHIEWCVLIYYV